jgi:hypothetical protein
MNRPVTLAALAAFALIGAAYPTAPRLDYVVDLDGGGPSLSTAPTTGAAASWRPCRRDPTDDNCIQLYERGVRAAYARWRRAHGATETRVAARHARRQQVALAERCAEPARRAASEHGDGASVSGM